MDQARMVKTRGVPKRWDVYAGGELLAVSQPYEEARLKVLFHNRPDYHRVWSPLFRSLPGVYSEPHERRMFRALELLDAGAIQPNGTPSSYDVQSQSHPNILYRVTATPTRWKCVMVDHPNASKKAEYCPDIASGSAPDFGHGPRCKHMIAVHFYRQLQSLHAPQEKAPAAPTAEASSDPRIQRMRDVTVPTQSTTSSPDRPVPQQPAIVARYPDGRAARRSDGTVIRYTPGGLAVEIPPPREEVTGA